VTAADIPLQSTDDVHEVSIRGTGGALVLRISVVLLAAGAVVLAFGARAAAQGSSGGGRQALWVGGVVLAAAGVTGLRGLTRVAPGEAVVLQTFGKYAGSLRAPGLWWVNPWTTRRRLSTKVRTDETATLKVNDCEGIPIDVAMVVIWRVDDTARALFAVDDIVPFVRSQCEMALRQVVACHRYEPNILGPPSLSRNASEIGDELSKEAARRVEPAGILVIEGQLVRISYAPEVAQAMLRRQQAAAVVAARHQIVEGAVGMVELALERLERDNVVELDEERKATMVSNLLVVLCSDHGAQPMVNAGSLYL
jgi:regulator of protease activity HflC (stomatin/prohibitin superfamily)